MGKQAILDAGHGGMIKGIYQTAGKRSPNWDKGVLYEGVFNREMVARVAVKLDAYGVPYTILVPEQSDISLSERVNRVKNIYKKNKDVWLLSFHANAGGGTGIEAFTTVGKTSADIIAERLLNNYEKDLKRFNVVMRYDFSDKDKDKESDFYLLKRVIPPAVLVENMFMDTKSDYDLMFCEDFKDTLAESIVRTIKDVYYGYI